MTERVTYEEIKESFLDAFYSYCGIVISNKKKRGQTSYSNAGEMYSGAIGYAYENSEKAYSLPVENLMLEIVSLILRSVYCSEQAKNYHHGMINKILSENNLDELTSDLDEEEKEFLLDDMSLLDLI